MAKRDAKVEEKKIEAPKVDEVKVEEKKEEPMLKGLEELAGKLKVLLLKEDKTPDDTKVADVLAKAKADGAEDLDGARMLVEADWVGYGVPKVKARQLVKELIDSAPKPAAPVVVPAAMASMSLGSLLPKVPDDGDLFRMLQTGGVAKMDKQDVIATVRALMGDRFNVFDLDDTVMDAIAERTKKLDEPYPQIYYAIEKAKTRRKRADVLAALEVPGRFVTDTRKKEFLTRTRDLWDVLEGFQGQLVAYEQEWLSKTSNPAMMMTAMAAMLGGGGALAPGLMDAPEPGAILDAAHGVIDTLNHMFAGAGIPVARALAADIIEVREFIEKPELMAAVGAGSRDEMLKVLGVAVSADVVRAERTTVQYALALLELDKIPEPQLPAYVVTMKQLGATIPWARLRGTDGKTTGRAKPQNPFPEESRHTKY